MKKVLANISSISLSRPFIVLFGHPLPAYLAVVKRKSWISRADGLYLQKYNPSESFIAFRVTHATISIGDTQMYAEERQLLSKAFTEEEASDTI